MLVLLLVPLLLVLLLLLDQLSCLILLECHHNLSLDNPTQTWGKWRKNLQMIERQVAIFVVHLLEHLSPGISFSRKLDIQEHTAPSAHGSKKSQTGPTERTPEPEYLIALSNFLRGPLVRSHSIFDGMAASLINDMIRSYHQSLNPFFDDDHGVTS